MNMEPVVHTHETVPPHDHDPALSPVFDPAIDQSSAVSSMMLMIIAVVAAVALMTVVVAWSPWNSSGTTNGTPGQGGQDQPLPGQRVPDRPSNPSQPQVIPTVSQQNSPR